MTSLALEPASTLSTAERAALFTAGYEGYLLPFALDEAALALMEHAFDLEPEASLVARLDGQAVGLANLGLRGVDGWVGGIGIVPAHRGRGHGETLMRALVDAARERGIRQLWLEVILENTAAVKLYEKLGFAHVRELEVWSLPGDPGSTKVDPAGEAHTWLREHSTGREPWQRADETVARLGDLDPAPAGLLAENGAALVRVSAGRVTLLQLAGEDDAAVHSLLERVRGLGESVLLLNLPADDPAAPVLGELEATVVVRQYEMLLEL
ncbi:MAG: GNAT family N-acetyltransferase [Actinobacteria bacterium]|nr:GNAT family N-acetyltransferase [Actinomycetota bacterium]